MHDLAIQIVSLDHDRSLYFLYMTLHAFFNLAMLRCRAAFMFVGLFQGMASLCAASSADGAAMVRGAGAPDSSSLGSSQSQVTPVLSSSDSLKKNAIRDSLIAEKVHHVHEFQKFPVFLDSIRNPRNLYRGAIFSSDAISLSDIAQTFPQIVSAPLSLSNGLNRFMPYGFPLPAAVIGTRGSLLGGPVQWYNGSDEISAGQLAEVSCGPGGALSISPADDDLVVPETQFLWENGLFYENILNVRVARPLSSNFNVSILSNNRFFKSEHYATKGDMSSLFNNFVKDTNLLVQSGQNPLVAEQNSQLRLLSKGKDGQKEYLTLGYADDQNEISHGFKDTTGGGKDSLQWDRIFKFGAQAEAGISGLRLSPVFLDIALKLVREGHTRHALADNTEKFGRNNEYTCAMQPYIGLHGDTAAVRAIVTRHEQNLYANANRVGHEADVSIAYAHHFRLWGMDGAGSGELGEHFLALRSVKTDNAWIGSLSAILENQGRMVRVFARRAVAPYPHLYDSVNVPFSDFFTPFQSFGAEATVTYKKAGIMAGVCSVSGVDGLDSTLTWPENVLPYRQPRVSWVIAPFFGRLRGFALTSRWMLQDTRPYLKARNSLSFQAHPLDGREHILVDLTFDYWSRRDSLTYGGASDWNREVLNVWLYTAVQIKTFSLFYKIDNLLNRSYAYVPGYRMPGITFRWGFQWLLQG